MSNGRPLGKAERFYWLFDRFSCTNFVITTELAVAPSTDVLQGAFERLRRGHPMLGAGITVVDGKPLFIELPATPLEVAWLDAGEMTGELERQLELRFALDAPLVRCTGYRHEDGRGTLLWTFSHALTDAGSAARLVRSLLAETTVRPAPPSPPTEALVSQAVRGLRLLLCLLGRMGREMVELLRVGKPQQPPHWPPLGAKRRKVLDLPIKLDRGQTDALVSRCRTEKTTVQGALCAAQLLALAGQFPAGSEPVLNIHSAVSLRPRLEPRPADDQPGLHISLLKTLHSVGPGADLWALARQVQTQLARKYARGEGELVWQLFPAGWFAATDDGARKLARVVGKDAVTSVVTNLGRLGEQDDEGALEAMGFAMGAHADCALVTAAVTYGGTLRLHCGFNTEVVSEEEASEMAEAMRMRLVAGT